jgi:hypothetical protein
MFYLLAINDGIPCRMLGPMEWQDCLDKGKDWINKDLTQELDRNMSQYEIDSWEMDGIFPMEPNGGYYIIQTEK